MVQQDVAQFDLDTYYETLAARFDQAAKLYDATYGRPTEHGRGNPLIGWLHDEFLALARATFPPKAALIDLGCGTGTDAIELALAGYAVLGLDVSPAMVRQAQTKQAVHSIQRGTTFKTLPAGRLGHLDERGPFQGAYSSLGALNTEPRLPVVAEELHELLEPGSLFVAMVMNRTCLFEQLRQFWRRDPTGILDRSGDWHTSRAGVGGVVAPVKFYSPDEFAAVFAPYFTVESVRALPLWLPPVNLRELYNRAPQRYRLAIWRDRLMRSWPGFRALGDHFVIVMRHQPQA